MTKQVEAEIKDGAIVIPRGSLLGRLRCRRSGHPPLAKIGGVMYCRRCGEWRSTHLESGRESDVTVSYSRHANSDVLPSFDEVIRLVARGRDPSLVFTTGSPVQFRPSDGVLCTITFDPPAPPAQERDA